MSALGEAILSVFLEASPYLLLGILLSFLIHAALRDEWIERWLSRGRWSSVVFAALFGIPLPLCSCGVLPLAAMLRSKGASRGAVVAFLISAPETGVDSILLTLGLMGAPFAILRPIAALVTAIVAGFLVAFFASGEGENGSVVPGCCGVQGGNGGFRARLIQSLRFVTGNLMESIAGWFVLGLILSGVITVLVPATLIESTVGGGTSGMLLVLVISVLLYVCASASTPVAAALLEKGMSPGTALVFLLGGPATNVGSLVVIRALIGTKSSAIYLGSIMVVSLLFGISLDSLSVRSEFWTTSSLSHDHSGRAIEWVSALIVGILLINGIVRSVRSRLKTTVEKPRENSGGRI